MENIRDQRFAYNHRASLRPWAMELTTHKGVVHQRFAKHEEKGIGE